MRSIAPLGLFLVSAGLIQVHGTQVGMPELGNLTSSAILGWYAWHTANKTIPLLVRCFREELAACRAHQQAEHEAFRQELAEERKRRHEEQAALNGLLERVVGH